MKRCLLLIAMAMMTLPTLSGCIIDPHRHHDRYDNRDDHRCDHDRDRDCHGWR